MGSIDPFRRPGDLENFAMGVELTLVSVLQGVPLAILIPRIADLFASGQLALLVYIPASVLVAVNVWALFVLHIMSVPSWPFDLTHNLLYFLVATTEAVMLAFLLQPTNWFISLAMLGVLLALASTYHGRMLSRRAGQSSPAAQALVAHVVAGQQAERRESVLYIVVGLLSASVIGALTLLGAPLAAVWLPASLLALAAPALQARWLAQRMAERSLLVEQARREPPV
jgi:hypothetical protein